ncbi:16S rRNA (adenine(1518)-N(6)/adenine(1519)-N(6))-dimethyltransferase RsmA [Aureimonas sp. Leaf324]|uniref:16S rRNA (adenine(1518)-N(6)/adenine(1519)-N(6))- dimethyltransferase RsmA n=1 Tax=Aureimonas sp. Leaf324 TaxID=1736336 RepID=UPI0006F34B6B|nr:16S rRNA (adenine(1518)-N(6)/adenine(1519)-N(6))-dimethyltransferase RsmA [Aureimonas sp. Leaf324]KQQ91272.1 16S rRNA methyltransferase [Aureimonas sp. Leaf324]
MSVAFDGLPPLREVLEAHGLDPRRALGQNFLLDLNLTGRIARQAAPLDGTTVVEVGPGPGGLTRALLANGAGKVVAIEKDPRCIPALEAIAAHYPGRLEVVEGDALAIDPADLTDGPFKIVANLPYNVGTQLLLNWITVPVWPPRWTDLTLMFQKEVAERIVAGPDDDHYGRLGVLCGWRCDAEILFDVSREAFTPPPKVTSAIVRIVPKPAPLAARLADIERVTAAAFGQRRKMLRQSVKPVGGEALLDRAGIDPTRRAETLSVEEFVRLANALTG